MMKQAILIALVLATATLSLASKEALIIDEDPSVDIEKVAELVCDVTKGSGKQIGRAATVGRLTEFFQALSDQHKLSRCRDQFGESVKGLQQVLETGNGNVCGNDKVTAIEQFHRRYISKVKKYKREREANGWLAPQLVKLVFMHYAYKISSICEQSAAVELAQVADKMADEGGDASLRESDQLMRQISEVAGISDLSKGYDGVFNLWNLLDKLPAEKSEKFSAYLSTTGNFKMSIAVQQATKLRQVQDQCADIMRPIYTRSLLGVLRLVDLGYYPADEFLISVVQERLAMKRLFVMTQVCEILLPIAVVEDAALSSGEIVMLPKDETNAGDLPDKNDGYPEVAENSLKNLDSLELAHQNNAKSLAKELKKAVRRRDDATKLIFKNMINCFRAKIKSKIGLMLMEIKGVKERAIEEDLAAEVDEKDLASLIEEDSKQSITGLGRRKRSFTGVMSRIVESVAYLIAVALSLVVATIYCVLFLTIVQGLLVFYKIFLKLTGIRILWIRDFQRYFHQPLIKAVDKYKEAIKNNED